MLFDSRLLCSVVGTFYTKGHAFLFIQEQPKTFPGDGAAPATAPAHRSNQISRILVLYIFFECQKNFTEDGAGPAPAQCVAELPCPFWC